MIYLIGGPARCGKSVLASRVREHINGLVLSGDAFVHALQKNLHPEWVPDIHIQTVAVINQLKDETTMIDRLRRRDESMWQFYEAYIRAAIADAPGDDILLEGNIWPDFLELFTVPHKAVFLIDTSPNQATRLMAIRNSENDNNWMRDFSNDHIRSWAQFNARRSERYVTLCQKSGYRYFDIAALGIEAASDKAYEHLLREMV